VSHVDTILIEIDSLDCLRHTANEMGCEWHQGQTEYKWWGHHVGDYPIPKGMTEEQLGKCDHVIKLPGCEYEIGVVKLPNGKYTLAYDFYGEGRKLLERFGPNLGKLVQMYGVNRATMAAKKHGHKVTRVMGKNGSIILNISQ
jgi:hypothetical protein